MERFRFRDALIDVSRRQILRDGQQTPLTTKEAAVLGYLAERAGRSVSRDELLREIWGYRVAVETRAVDNVVRRLRVKLGEDARSPTGLYTTHGEGYCLRLEAALSQPRSFFGREAELEALRSAWQRGVRLVSVLGGPGLGKSALVLQHVEALRAEGAEIAWCEAREGQTAEELAFAAAAALGLPVAGLQQALALRGSCGLVLDGADLAADATVALCSSWLAAAPQLRLWVVARQALSLAADTRLQLGPLAAEAGVALFRARSTQGGWSWEQTHTLVRLLDGHPLAIELAAGRSRIVQPEELLRRLGAEAQPRALRAVVASSWESLDAQTRLAWAQCSVFPATFDLAAAEAVLQIEGGVAERLETLADHFLVQPDKLGRLRLYAAFRSFGLERLSELDERQASERFSAHFGRRALELADALEGPAPRLALEAIETEMANLLEVRRSGAPADRCRAELALVAWARLRRPIGAGGLDEAVALAREHAPELLSQLLCARASCSDYAQAEADLLEAVACAPAPPLLVAALTSLAQLLRRSHGPSPEVDALLEEAAWLARDDPRLALLVRSHRTDSALSELEEVVTAARELGAPLLAIRGADRLGTLLRQAGRPLDADRTYELAAEDAEALGWRTQLHALALRRADLALALGRPDDARSLLEDVADELVREGAWELASEALGTLALADLAQDLALEANRRLTTALELVRPLGEPPPLERLHLLRAVARARMGHAAEARLDLARASELGATHPSTPLAEAYVSRSRPLEALAAFEQGHPGPGSADAAAEVVAGLLRRGMGA